VYYARVNQNDALAALEDAEVIPCLQAALGDAKELLEACLEADIPALLDRGACCGSAGCGCAPKLELLVRPEDLPRVKEVLDRRWQGMLDREGTLEEREAAGGTESEACPACGTAEPLQEGACTGCGLQLG
jgi:hypothetical protein